MSTDARVSLDLNQTKIVLPPKILKQAQELEVEHQKQTMR